MKIFIATLSTETNVFSPIPTGRQAFLDDCFYRRDSSLQPTGNKNVVPTVWRKLAQADGHVVVESICAAAQPSGRTIRAIYEEFRDLILQDLREAMPVDAVLLNMHGAMIAQDYDDCEGDTLARVRAMVGPRVPIGIELDLHCHLTELMRTNADAIITFKEFPHTDALERARELYNLITQTQLGKIRPAMAYYDCRMLAVLRTPFEPVRSFVNRMQSLEGKDGVLSISLGHGYAWGDMPEMGAKVVVITDGDMGKAEKLACRLGQEIWEMRNHLSTPHDSIDGAIDFALNQGKGPVVLADEADNPGDGAPGDSTPILRRLIERGVDSAAIGCMWDPIAVHFCTEAEVGAVMNLRVGGKCGVVSDQPLDLRVTVRAISENHLQTGLAGARISCGKSAWVSTNGVDIILISKRCQTFSPDAFTGLGCNLDDKRIVVVKSSQHFYANFAPMATAVRYVEAPGLKRVRLDNIPYTKFTKPYWPKVADPFKQTVSRDK